MKLEKKSNLNNLYQKELTPKHLRLGAHSWYVVNNNKKWFGWLDGLYMWRGLTKNIHSERRIYAKNEWQTNSGMSDVDTA